MKTKVRLVIHGGAGILKINESNEQHIVHNLEKLKEIVTTNYNALLGGAKAVDVVEQAVIELEDHEGFNAGRGSVLNSNGNAELDASIMDGRSHDAGAIAAVQRVKNPISGARAIMEYSQHVLLAGPNADAFCELHRVKMVPYHYYIIEERKQQLAQAQSEGHVQDLDSLGTVGAVVRDINGNLAAATSTGGKTNKTPGRVGDSPIIGAGTWADNNTCAVSATGDGELFLRCAFAHEIASIVKYTDDSLAVACKRVLKEVFNLGGEGGCIAIDKHGEIAMAYNTLGMYRAWIDDDGVAHSAI